MQETHKLLIVLCSWLICFALPAQQLAPDQRLSRPKPALKENQQKTKPPQAIGVILSFHQWPSEKEQQNISKILNQDGLTLSKKFESFKSLVFSWPKLKTKNKAQNVCRKLSKLKNLNYCEPDSLLRPNNAPVKSDSKTEAGSPVTTCTADCDNQTISTQNLLSEIQSLPKTTSSCKLAPSKHNLKDGKLTDYWAQEMVGADLLKEELEKAPPLPEDKYLVAVFDDTNNNHNVHVQNIISHEGPQAVLPALNSSQLEFFKTKWDSDYTYTYASEFLNSKQFPSFINNSMSWEGSRNIYDVMSRISPPSILVKSAGDEYSKNSPSIDPIDSEFSKNFDSIIVGSLSPRGVVSEYSQEGEEVHILAPSDDYLTSVDNNGNYKQFGDTHGAAPLVTGSLAGFEWLSGYHPTAEEAKFLLENTAIPTLHSALEDPKKNGKGMLNAYKLGRVAQRLKDKCKNDRQCFKKEIKNSENYHFSTHQRVLKDIKSAFPKCSGSTEDLQEDDCTFKKAIFKKLRQAVLLDTTNVELWKKLHCIYNQEGFSENALAVGTTVLALSKNLKNPTVNRIKEEFAHATKTKGEARGLEILQTLTQGPSQNVRNIIAQGSRNVRVRKSKSAKTPTTQSPSQNVRKTNTQEAKDTETRKPTPAQTPTQSPSQKAAAKKYEELQTLQQLLATNPDLWVRRGIAQEAGKLGTIGLPILQTLMTDKAPYVRVGVADEAGKIGGVEGLAILQTLATDKDASVRESAAGSIGLIGGDEGLELLQTLATDNNKYVRATVARAAGQIGGVEGLTLLQTLATEKDPKVRKEATWGASSLGGNAGLALLQTLMTDQNAKVREGVALAAKRIGGDEGFQILKTLAKDPNKEVREMSVKYMQQLNPQEARRIREAERLKAAEEARKVREAERLKAAEEARKIREAERLKAAEEAKRRIEAEFAARPVKRKAIQEAGKIGGEEGLQRLQTLATDTDAVIRGSVAMEAGKIGGEGGKALLQKLATDTNGWVREQAARGAGNMGPEGLELLKPLITDDGIVRAAVAQSAGKIGGEEGRQIMQTLVTDTNQWVRSKVAQSAGNMGPEGLEFLKPLVTDEKEMVRAEVARSAGKIGGVEGLALLQPLVTDKDKNVREQVARGAGKIGGVEGLALLQPLVTDKAKYVRKRVAESVGIIGGVEGLALLQPLATDKDPKVREEVTWSAGKIGERKEKHCCKDSKRF